MFSIRSYKIVHYEDIHAHIKFEICPRRLEVDHFRVQMLVIKKKTLFF